MSTTKPTRQLIKELLKKHKELSASGLTNFLDITEMAVRKHLAKLEANKIVASRTVRQPMGRPVIFYHLTQVGHNTFPNSYGQFAVNILQDIHENFGDEAIDVVFKEREKRLKRTYRRRIFPEDSLLERVEQLVELQQENGYMAEFTKSEQVNEEVEICFEQFNCPIAAISDRYDKPCELELKLFKDILETEQIERIECIAKGGESCKYLIKKDLTANSKVVTP